MKDETKRLSTEPYKGVRDFFPEDMAVENHIFNIWRNTVRLYGYEEYAASVLEPAELYMAKTGEEIVNEQTYTFTDRGERQVTLRPEMTPSLARMVALRRRELVFPLRWYSIPNLFRYEKPQRGRLREHWQLNADIFGVSSLSAEVEIISMAVDITRAYGLGDADFEVRINNRKVMNCVTADIFKLDPDKSAKLSRLMDKKDKVRPEWFEAAATELLGDRTGEFLTLMNSRNFEEFASRLPQTGEEHRGLKEVREVMAGLERLGITNARFDQSLMRGFDYYTGIVFEIFDLNPENRRSVFGGGRYDDLLSIFGSEKVTAVGFGAGDVVARDLMATYGTLPAAPAPADIEICMVGEGHEGYAFDLAQSLRRHGLRVAVDISGRKIGDQFGNAAKRNIPYVLAIGEQEVKSGRLRIKNMISGEETGTDEEGIARIVRNDYKK